MKKIFLYRVSTKSQDISMQVEAAKPYKTQFADYEVIEIEEFGVSSNKVPLSERPKMVEALHLIKSGHVDTVYVYDRSRLTRKFYEYFQIINLFYIRKVKVVFTTTDPAYPAFTRDPVSEGLNAILIEEEGKRISGRTLDNYRKRPHRKFGYNVERKDGSLNYSLNPSYESMLSTFFQQLKSVQGLSDFGKLVTTMAKESNRPLDLILRTAIDPFYAGHEKSNNHYILLPSIPAYINLYEHQEIVRNIEPLIKQISFNQSELLQQCFLEPKCFHCNKMMRYYGNEYTMEAYYKCNKCKKSNQIPVWTLLQLTKNVSESVMDSLNVDELKIVVAQALKSYEKELRSTNDQLKTHISDLEYSLVTKQLRTWISSELDDELQTLIHLKEEQHITKSYLYDCELALSNVNQLCNIIKERASLYSHEVDLVEIAPYLIKNIYVVSEEQIEVEVYFDELLDTMEPTLLVEVNDE